MQTLLQDVRYAIRILSKSPGFVAVAVLTLALGIGANAAIFSVVDAVLLRPLPFPEPERLVRVFDVQPDAGLTTADFPEFLDWRGQSHLFDQMGSFFSTTATLSAQGMPEQLSGLRVSANLLSLLGAEPLAGRGFRPEEEQRGAERVCLITEGLWARRFGRDPSILRTTLTLSEQPVTVVGIVRNPFQVANEADFFMPLRLDEKVAPRGLHFITVIGRLRPGLTLAQAQKDSTALAERLKKDRSIDHGIQIVPLKEDLVQGTQAPLAILFGAVGFVLLIACANLAGLFLARGQQRRREVAIRSALGSTRWQIVRMLLTESLVVAAAGGFLSLLTARWLIDVLFRLGLERIPRAHEIRLDGTVFLFTTVITILTAVLFGLSPALATLKAASAESLKEGTRGGGTHRARQRSVLVVSEVALSLVLLIGAGLLLRSFAHLLHTNKGFSGDHVLTFHLGLDPVRYEKPGQQAAFFRNFLSRSQALPGVESVGLISNLALSGDNTNGGVKIEGRNYAPKTSTFTNKRFASAGYFHAMRIPLRRGRSFNERDVQGAPAVALINDTFAKRYFSGEDPIGKRVAFLWGIEGMQEIVGVVGDVREDALNLPPDPEMYVVFDQRPEAYTGVVVRATGDPAALVAALREQIHQLDANLPMAQVRTMEEIVASSVGDVRLRTLLLGCFATIALLLATLGLYGLVSYSVSQRTQEIGIHMAMGAQPGTVLTMVLKQGLRLAALGVAIGLLAALGLARFLESLLFGTKPTDVLTFAGITVLMGLVTLAACYLPARRATRVDPLVALRYE